MNIRNIDTPFRLRSTGGEVRPKLLTRTAPTTGRAQ